MNAYLNLAVVGPGALGCLLAARLHLAGACRVRLVDHDAGRAATLNRQGIILEGPAAPSASPLPIPVTADYADTAGCSAVIFCVKSLTLPQALADAVPFADPATPFITFTNGISHLEQLCRLRGRCLPVPGICTAGATLLAPGRVRPGGPGTLTMGHVDSASSHWAHNLADPLHQISQTFRQAGFDTRISTNIQRELWHKLLVNVGINALTVVHDCPNGRLLEIPAARQQMALAVNEAAAVAEASGIALGMDPLAMVEEVCRRTATNISSMLQDIRQHRATEIMAINGEIVRRAHQLGMTAPANEELTKAIKQRHPKQ
ncbi:ketopantoate reductase family protein [Desulfurivibrio alkaliphilus]|uniref:2-dehydropantoate 2-reductase n=1 Tax=Desulfurivibrio alkaliphilus (strain DSM 19089 / UNIQEM U267 / AHT2) TaxID=589865 RepID=D6Z0C1_DESAT|nr:2-dehydropantoate 2-reductase [Desulfurivibrio alkaliphilus]ADH87154.1 2-dehydropantoate 2-reductase [Desulfurivibrio alkaliphilus AHT 2]